MICSYQKQPGEADVKGRFVFACANKGCGNRLAAESLEKIRSGQCNGPECIHLGRPTDETVTCKGCKGSPVIHAVWTCAAVEGGKCLPTVRRTKAATPNVHRCDGCQLRSVGP